MGPTLFSTIQLQEDGLESCLHVSSSQIHSDSNNLWQNSATFPTDIPLWNKVGHLDCQLVFLFLWSAIMLLFVSKRENVNVYFSQTGFSAENVVYPNAARKQPVQKCKGVCGGRPAPQISLLLLTQTQPGPRSQNKNQNKQSAPNIPFLPSLPSPKYINIICFEGSTFFFPCMLNKLPWKRYLYYVPFRKTKADKESCHWSTPSALIKTLHDAWCC